MLKVYYSACDEEKIIEEISKIVRNTDEEEDAFLKAKNIIKNAFSRTTKKDIIDIWYANTQLGSNASKRRSEKEKNIFFQVKHILDDLSESIYD